MEQQVHKISCCKLSLRHNLLTLLFLYKTRNAIIISLSGIVGAACTAHSFVLKLLDHNAWVKPPLKQTYKQNNLGNVCYCP